MKTSDCANMNVSSRLPLHLPLKVGRFEREKMEAAGTAAIVRFKGCEGRVAQARAVEKFPTAFDCAAIGQLHGQATRCPSPLLQWGGEIGRHVAGIAPSGIDARRQRAIWQPKAGQMKT